MSKSQTISRRVSHTIQAKKVKPFRRLKPDNPYRAAAELMHNHPGLEAFVEELEELRRRDELEYLERE
jgi:hypothetical protein